MGEPLVYNIASLFALLGGSVHTKIKYDCIPRQPYAFSILTAANHAKSYGIDRVTIIEFGVAAGAGLMNMCWIAEQVTRETGVKFNIVGFNSGEGMPPPVDYRDHPEKYFTGDFPPIDRQALLDALPSNAKIYFGPIDTSLAKAREEDQLCYRFRLNRRGLLLEHQTVSGDTHLGAVAVFCRRSRSIWMTFRIRMTTSIAASFWQSRSSTPSTIAEKSPS